VEEDQLEPFTFVSYPYESFHLVMPLYLCRSWNGDPYGAEGQNIKWVTSSDLIRLPLPTADILFCHRILDILKKKKIFI